MGTHIVKTLGIKGSYLLPLYIYKVCLEKKMKDDRISQTLG